MRLRDLSSHGKLRTVGRDRVRFLNGLLTNDVAALRPGEGCHAAMLTVKGRVIAEGIVLADEDALWIDVEPALAAKVLATLERHAIVDDVSFEDQSAALDEIGVYGEGARAALEAVLGALPELPRHGHLRRGETRVVAVRDLGLDGYRLIGGARPIAARLADRADWIADDEAEVLRVEAGVPRYGVDVGEDHLPIEARLDDAISHTKGCYMGQEPIARLAARGHVNRRLCGLRLDGDGPAPAGATLSAPGRDDAGHITSSVRSPRLGPIALGYVHRSLWAPGTALTVREPQDGATRTATVVELPFPGAW
jgi:folate-binding protein YgfZ